MHLLYSTPEGDLARAAHLRPVDYAHQPLAMREMIPLPVGASLMMLPECAAAGLDAGGNLVTVPAERGWAVSALLPIGYTRTAVPGYVPVPGKRTLPLFGYTAIAEHRGRLYAAALPTDDPSRWGAGGPDAGGPRLRRLVERRLAAEPENRLLGQLAKCTLEYGCNTARNVFTRQWEAAIPCSPGCSARCLGCISKQEEPDVPSPQERLTFVPTVDEIAAIAVPHLEQAPDAMVSFGQGCEGEPLLQAPLIARAIAAIRQRTSAGTINVNSHAGHPVAFEMLCRAGLQSVRVSVISARAEYYHAYYRPTGYTFADVRASLLIAQRHGVYRNVNLLTFPGFTDTVDEVAAMIALFRETSVQRIQIRNLNVDPDLFLGRLPAFNPARLGVAGMIDALHEALPGVEIGNYSRPVGAAGSKFQVPGSESGHPVGAASSEFRVAGSESRVGWRGCRERDGGAFVPCRARMMGARR